MKMKKFFGAALVALSILSATCIGASAETVVPEQTHSEEAESGESNVFDMLYDGFIENADEIFSALAFIGTLIIGFAYKKGLTPMITGAIGQVASAVTKMKDESKTIAEGTDAGLSAATERLAKLENTLTLYAESLSALEERLGDESEARCEREKLRIILSSQVDMLYEIFMSSALPAYQKEAIGKRISRMKKDMGEDEKSE